MVFEKNLMSKTFFFIKFFIILLSGCTYQYNNSIDSDKANVAKVNLNVNSFEIKKNNLNDLQNKNELSETINKKVLKNFEDWILIKFAIDGDQNKSFLNILEIDTRLIKKKREKKSILSTVKEKNNIHTTILNFDLTFTNNQDLTKILKVSSNIEIILSSSFSINKRDKVIASKINELIQLIDEKITKKLNEDDFKEFIIN